MLKNIFVNFFTFINLLGAFASIYAIRNDADEWAIGILSMLLVVFAITLIYYKIKTIKMKKEIMGFYKCCEYLHDSIHNARDKFVTEILRDVQNRPSELTDLCIQIIRKSLEELENCFSKLTGCDCQASIMLPDDYERPTSIVTTIRSGTETGERRKAGVCPSGWTVFTPNRE